jgi:hypothetical protein
LPPDLSQIRYELESGGIDLAITLFSELPPTLRSAGLSATVCDAPFRASELQAHD